ATGPADGDAFSDPDWLLSVTETGDAPDLVAPYRFRLAASPLVAAAHANVAIDPTRITQALRTLSARHDCVLVEGVGGVLVPVTVDLFVVDLIKRLRLPVLHVAATSGCAHRPTRHPGTAGSAGPAKPGLSSDREKFNECGWRRMGPWRSGMAYSRVCGAATAKGHEHVRVIR